LDAIYEQVTRGAAGRSDLVGCSDLSYEHDKNQVITGSLGYAHLVIQLSEHKRELQHARMWRETQEQEAQRTYTKFVDSQNCLHRQLELSRAREQNLHADLFAAEKEHEKLKALISTLEASQREQQGWEEIAATAKARCAEAEMTASKLRVDLAAAVDRVCSVQEQLVRQMELASDKDKAIQSITEESRKAHTRLRIAEDKIKRLDARVLDLRVGEKKKPLDEQVGIEDRHERRQTQDALRHAPPLNRDHRPRYHRRTTTWPNDTDQPPLPPEQIRYTGTPPVSSAINPDSSSRPTKWPPTQNRKEPDISPHMRACLLQIAGIFDEESEVAKEQRAAQEGLNRHMRQGQVELQGTQDVKPNERESLLGERKKSLDGQVVIRDRQERRQTRDALHHVPSLNRDRRPRYQRPTTAWPNDTGQPPLPPEQIRNTGTLPVSSAINPELQVAAPSVEESEVAKERELYRLMRQNPVGLRGTLDMKTNQRERETLRDEIVRLQEKLAVANLKQSMMEDEARDVRRELDQSKVTLREAEEEGRGLRLELDQSKETLREVESHVMALEYELSLCQATLLEAQDTQQASKVELDEMAQLLRQRQAESESSMARAEESQFKCAQVTLLCAALQERVTELEAQVKILKSTQKHPARRAVHTNSRSPCPTATGTQASYLCRLGCSYIPVLSDPEATTRHPDKQDSDSIYMTVKPSMPRPLDLSLPSSDSSLYLCHQKCSATPPVCVSPQFCPIDTGTLAPIFRRSYMLIYSGAIRS
jgi:hypothetical protein